MNMDTPRAPASYRWSLLLLLGFLPQLAAAIEPQPDTSTPAPVLDEPALVEALRGGGYIVYLRHGITDLDTEDRDRTHLENCATQRRLSAAGRAQVQGIGEAFRQLGIPVGAVYSSPYCRSLNTARLAFGRADPVPDLAHTVTASEAQATRQAQTLRGMLATAPAAGFNTVISGHTGNLQEATGIWPQPEGAAVIFQPAADGSFGFIGMVHPDRWQAFVTAGY